MKILIGGFYHETSTFSNIPVNMERLASRTLYYYDNLIEHMSGTSTEIGGFIDVLRANEIDIVPSMYASATPAGPVTSEAYEECCGYILQKIKDNPDIDGVLLCLHGAMVSDNFDDGEGELLRRVREIMGDKIPVIATLDYHTNMGREMVDNATALFAYKTYPHIDMHDRGLAAANLMVDILTKGVKPKIAFKWLPLISPPVVQGTAREPMKSIMDQAKATEAEEGIISVSVTPGFSYADVPMTGFSVYIISNDDQELADDCAKQLADYAWARRFEFESAAIPVKEAVEQAMSLHADQCPVALADVADNPGAGTAGDGTAILAELIRIDAQNTLVTSMTDPEVAAKMHELGIGAEITVDLGGKTDNLHGAPVKVTGEVVALHDGKFIFQGIMHGGEVGNLGKCGLLRVGGIDIVIHTTRMQSFEPQMPMLLGADPTKYKIVLIKSSIHYRAAYEPVMKTIIEVDAPGLSGPDLTKFSFKKLVRPIFPLDNM